MKPDVDRMTGNTTEFYFSCIVNERFLNSNSRHLEDYRMEFDFSLSGINGGSAICMIDKNLLASRVYDR